MSPAPTPTLSEHVKHGKQLMDKAVEAVKRDFTTVRTGKATTALLDLVRVEAYGNEMPLTQVASVAAPEPKMLTVQPWDKGLLKAVEKGILASDLGLTPSNDGNVIRIPIPPLTEERRKELVKVVRTLAEEGRVAIRNIRRDVMHDLRELRDAGEAGTDDEHRAEEALQKLTDEKIKELDAVLKAKEEEILEV
jgi:ribosome recycling factor